MSKVHCHRCRRFISNKDQQDPKLRLEADPDLWACKICVNIDLAFDMNPHAELKQAEKMGIIPPLEKRQNWQGADWLIMRDSLLDNGLQIAAEYFRLVGTYEIESQGIVNRHRASSRGRKIVR